MIGVVGMMPPRVMMGRTVFNVGILIVRRVSAAHAAGLVCATTVLTAPYRATLQVRAAAATQACGQGCPWWESSCSTGTAGSHMA